MNIARVTPLRSPYLLIAVAALLLYVWGFALQCRKPSLPAHFEAEAAAYPIILEGLTAAGPDQLRFLIEGWTAGDSVTIRLADGREREVVLEQDQSIGLLIVTATSGLFFWSVAFFVFVPRVREPAVPIFFWILLLYGLAVMVGGVFFQDSLVSPRALFGLLQIICLALLPPTFLLLTLRFPAPGVRPRTADALMPVLWAAAVGLIAWQAWAYGRYFTTPAPEYATALGPPTKTADVYMLSVVAGGFGILLRRIGRVQDPRQVRQIRWLLWGFAVGAAPYLLLRTLPQLIGLPTPLPAGADRVLEMAVPLAFVFAVVREQFLDIDVVIRRSLLYSTLAGVAIILMLVPSLVLTWSFGQIRPNTYRVALLCGGLTAGLVFNPLRRGLGLAIDRWVLELPRDESVLLDGLEAGLARATTPGEVVATVEETVGGWFGSRPVSLDLTSATGGSWGSLLVRPGASDAPDLEDDAFPAEWAERGFVVACTANAGGERCGWMLIGPRISRRRYLRRDLELGSLAARRAAAVLERLRLRGEKADEERARRQLDELNRMKSDFLAQVAHDLRTPVTSVSWSTRNLLDGLAGDLTPPQREYLASVRDAAGHLDTLVTNLLDLSRLDRAVIELPLRAFDPAPCVEQAASSLKSVADAAQVRLVVVPGPPSTACGNPEKLVEILVNILDNAVKYSPPGGVVRASAAAADAARCWTLVVEDEGPGLDSAADLFERFVQGRPSPHSSRKGFGLGLYIVRQYLQMMQGDVTADNIPGGGARFTLRLPLAPPH